VKEDTLFVKLRVALPGDWQTIAMADRLGCDVYDVCGRLAYVWAWAGKQAAADADHVPGVPPGWLDREFRMPGLAAAMAAVGWLVASDAGLRFPGLREWTFKPGLSSSPAAQKTRRLREKWGGREAPKPDGTKAEPDGNQSGTKVEPEGNQSGTLYRERDTDKDLDKDIPPQPPKGGGEGGGTRAGEAPGKANPPEPKARPKKTPAELPDSLPAAIDTPECRAALERWMAYKRERRDAYVPSGLASLLTKVAAWGPDAVVAAVETSMANNWKGLFPPRADERAPAPERPPPRVETLDELVARTEIELIQRQAAKRAEGGGRGRA